MPRRKILDALGKTGQIIMAIFLKKSFLKNGALGIYDCDTSLVIELTVLDTLTLPAFAPIQSEKPKRIGVLLHSI